MYRYFIDQAVIGRLAGKKLFGELVRKLGKRK